MTHSSINFFITFTVTDQHMSIKLVVLFLLVIGVACGSAPKAAESQQWRTQHVNVEGGVPRTIYFKQSARARNLPGDVENMAAGAKFQEDQRLQREERERSMGDHSIASANVIESDPSTLQARNRSAWATISVVFILFFSALFVVVALLALRSWAQRRWKAEAAQRAKPAPTFELPHVAHSQEFVNIHNHVFYRQSWVPRDTPPVGVVVFVHGLHAHCDRLAPHVELFTAKGLIVVGIDLVGHGRSSGIHGLLPPISECVEHVHSLVEQLMNKSEYLSLPFFLMGESAGGLILLEYIIAHPSPRIAGFISLGALVHTSFPPAPSWLLRTGQFLSSLWPEMPLLPPAHPIKGRVFTDHSAAKDWKKDPLLYHGFMRVQTGMELNSAIQYLQQRLHMVDVPIYAEHGDDDGVTSHLGLEALIKASPCPDQTLTVRPGARHVLLCEPDGLASQIVDSCAAWALDRVLKRMSDENAPAPETPPRKADLDPEKLRKRQKVASVLRGVLMATKLAKKVQKKSPASP